MPLINVIRGERIEPAPFNVRPPILHLPLWMVLAWWTVKGLVRLVVLACRYYYITGPAALLVWLYLRYGWAGPISLVAGLALIAGVWWWAHQPSFLRFACYPALGRWRRWVYRRRWHPAMATAKLAVGFDGQVLIPVLKRVRSRAGYDELSVRTVTGQIPDDFAKVSERLAHTFGVLAVKAIPGPKVGTVVLLLQRRDPLTRTFAPSPVPAVPDFTALPIAKREDGEPYRLPLFARFACKDLESIANMLEEALAVAQQRADRLRGQTRQHIPTVDEPLILIVIDELAALTAYVTDRRLKDRIKAALVLLLTQGRAVCVHVLAALQDPRKEVLPFRNLFPTRIGLRLSEDAEVDMVLGEGARDRGALCDRIPMSQPGTAFVLLDGDPTPQRIRFPYTDDAHIADLARAHGRLRLVDQETA